jgi:hypothetical protein
MLPKILKRQIVSLSIVQYVVLLTDSEKTADCLYFHKHEGGFFIISL